MTRRKSQTPASKKGRKSCNKGKRWEREFVRILKKRGIECRRDGGPGRPDVITRHFEFECKESATVRLKESLDEAVAQGASWKMTPVAYKRNERRTANGYEPPLFFFLLPWEDGLRLIEAVEAAKVEKGAM